MKRTVCILFLICPWLAWAKPTWQASMGESGGFTGGGASVTVLSDGRVVRGAWDVALAPPKEQVVRTLSVKEVSELKKILCDPALVKLRLNQPGNMTGFLNYQEGKVVRHYAWPKFYTLPEPLQRACTALESAASAKK